MPNLAGALGGDPYNMYVGPKLVHAGGPPGAYYSPDPKLQQDYFDYLMAGWTVDPKTGYYAPPYARGPGMGYTPRGYIDPTSAQAAVDQFSKLLSSGQIYGTGTQTSKSYHYAQPAKPTGPVLNPRQMRDSAASMVPNLMNGTYGGFGGGAYGSPMMGAGMGPFRNPSMNVSSGARPMMNQLKPQNAFTLPSFPMGVTKGFSTPTDPWGLGP